MTEFNQGDTFEEPDGDRVWQITDVRPVYEVAIMPKNGSEDPDDAETTSYPASSLERKLEYGDLTWFGEGGGSGEAREEVDCTECDETFKSEQGMKSHRSQVHTESESESE